MAQNTENAARIAALCQRSAQSRAVLTRQIGILRHRIDLPARIRESVISKPYTWFGGSLAVGLMASLILRRKPARQETRHRKPFLAWLFAALFAATKPMLKTWLTGELKTRLQPLLQRPAAPR